MALDLSKIKGISDEVKAKLAKATNKEEMLEVIKAENLTEEQMKELSGESDGCYVDYCWEDIVCCPIDIQTGEPAVRLQVRNHKTIRYSISQKRKNVNFGK